jgi:hypothetical protein
MQKKRKIFISDVQNLSTARFAAGVWADYIGISFDPSSSSYVEPAQAKEMLNWINGPELVLQFGHQPVEWIRDFNDQFKPVAVLLPYDYKDEAVNSLSLDIWLKVIKENVPNELKLPLFQAVVSEGNKNITIGEGATVFIKCDAGSRIDDDCHFWLEGQAESETGMADFEDWNEFLEKIRPV